MIGQEFDNEVLSAILAQNGNSRFPSPLTLCVHGEETALSANLREEGGPWDDVEHRVFGAVKRLHRAGLLIFIRRYGYTWVASPRMRGVTPRELVDGPDAVNEPWGWDDM